MDFLFNIINVPLSWVLKFLSGIMGNSFAWALVLFTLFINLCMLPLSIKSQKSSVGQMRIKPKLDELKKKYGDDKQRYSQEMQKLYQEENISMGGGCLPLIIRMVFMLSVYSLIRSPLTYLMGISQDVVDRVWPVVRNAAGLAENTVVDQIRILNAVQKDSSISAEIASKLGEVDFKFFGLDLTQTPDFGWNVIEAWQNIWLIPILAFAAQMLTSVISMAIQKKLNPEAPSMAGMMLTMPLISLFIGFSLPGAVGFYWICSSLIGSGIQHAVQIFYGPHKMLAKERATGIIKVWEEEKKFIEKRVDNDTDAQ
ncbi:MAG: YidC/Oxa1 family membrane protein insertase [Clostridia bacterium]|nr:YidC/Oxa1 family membrane protein insertase [Clostridia bacterium]